MKAVAAVPVRNWQAVAASKPRQHGWAVSKTAAGSVRRCLLQGGVLDDGHDATRHEASRANNLTATGQLGHLDRPTGDQHVDPASFARRRDLELAHLVAPTCTAP